VLPLENQPLEEDPDQTTKAAAVMAAANLVFEEASKLQPNPEPRPCYLMFRVQKGLCQETGQPRVFVTKVAIPAQNGRRIVVETKAVQHPDLLELYDQLLN